MGIIQNFQLLSKNHFYTISVINNKINKKYKEEFLEDIRLESHTRQDLQTFKEHFKKIINMLFHFLIFLRIQF